MKIGKIIQVEYNQFRVRLFQTTRNSTASIDGVVYYFGNIGSYLKTSNVAGEKIICEVISVLDYVSSALMPSKYNLDSSREVVMKPIGTIDKSSTFSLGVGIYPALYADVEIVVVEDMENILGSGTIQPDASGIHRTFHIGASKSMLNYPIHLNIDKFFQIHTAILGNTGSGKSNTVAHILQQIYRKESNFAEGAKTILFDSNGEYMKAFSSSTLYEKVKTVFYKPSARENLDDSQIVFPLPYYLMNLDEWLGFLMASERTQAPFWDKVLQTTYKFYKVVNTNIEDNTKFVNYFKWKVLNILSIVLAQVDSDTARITAARSIIYRCGQMLSQDQRLEDLRSFLQEAENHCTISYGDNNSKLSDFLQSVSIDEESALSIDAEKLQTGDYYNYHFLSVAVEITLLEEEARGNVRIREYASTMLTRLDYFLNNQECGFMRSDNNDYQTTEDYLRKVLGIGISSGARDKQLVVIDCSEINADTLELLTSVVSRLIFDYRKKLYGAQRRKDPVHLIMDEAHRYIKKDAQYILRENIFEKIAREGRKYSLYLILSSQRPSELSGTILFTEYRTNLI